MAATSHANSPTVACCVSSPAKYYNMSYSCNVSKATPKSKAGRHTPRKGAPTAAGVVRGDEPRDNIPDRPAEILLTTPPSPPTANSRYTPPRRATQLTGFRPPWHRWLAAGLLLGALAIIGLNDAMRFTTIGLLPGGHSELYLLLGLALGAISGRFFGIFDRES